MLKKLYIIFILPYSITLLYLMLLGFGREQYSSHLIRLSPVISTIELAQNSRSLWHILSNLLGNIILFIPFGFLGWVNARFNDYKILIFNFLSAIIIIETLQYFSRMGVFDIDDLILNAIGASIGFWLKNIADRLGINS